MDENKYLSQVSDARREYLANTYEHPAFKVILDMIDGCFEYSRAVLDDIDRDMEAAYDALLENDLEDMDAYIGCCADEASDVINSMKEAIGRIESFRKELKPYLKE